MIDVVIIGGGVSGLALARSLQAQGRSFVLYEARERLGGRVLTVPCADSGLMLDLGPGWFWPESQPLMARLVAALGLEDFPQADDGSALLLRDPETKPEPVHGAPVHGGARRIEGGMGRLVEALASGLPMESLCSGHMLMELRDGGGHVQATLRAGDRLVEVMARQVVLAMPPRLVAERVSFVPELDARTLAALQGTATWMAARAKVVIGYERPFWREAGQAGNAFVTHEQAVLGEIFDACGSSGTPAALGGFLALTPALREAFGVGLPLLMESQVTQVFGPSGGEGVQYYQDWATEPFTCTAQDRAAAPGDNAEFGNPLLRAPLWGGKLHFGGSETGAQGAGYLEGALEAARRIERLLGRARGTADTTGGENAKSLERFRAWVSVQGDVALNSYRHRLNRGLALQQREQLTQRALLGAVEEVYSNALDCLGGLAFATRDVPVERGCSALTPQVQAPFGAFLKNLVDDVIAFNRASCALSNFPSEHQLSGDYMQTILRDIAAAWQEFSLAANALLRAK